jgi:hypothetical protein
MAKRGIVIMGQSNGFSGVAEDLIDAFRTHPNLWQFKNNDTYQQSPSSRWTGRITVVASSSLISTIWC